MTKDDDDDDGDEYRKQSFRAIYRRLARNVSSFARGRLHMI